MLLACFVACVLLVSANGILFPQENEHRELKELDGLWWFAREPANSEGVGFANGWFHDDISKFQNVTRLPVPCAYNDLTQDIQLRDHVGWVWYQRDFYIPSDWQQRRVVIRFGSVNYFAAVFINGHNVVNHTGGHLPFEVIINDVVTFMSSNRVTVAVNNTLSYATIPPGEFVYKKGGMGAVSGKHYEPWTALHMEYPSGYFEQTPDFDFFNYAGILRPVYLYTTDHVFIKDIGVITTIDGVLNYTVTTFGMSNENGDKILVRLRDDNNAEVAANRSPVGTLTVDSPQLWWPIGMGHRPGYLYTLEVTLSTQRQPKDIYRLPVGIRDVKVGSSLLINGKPFYCHGFGMHEDSEIRGRGFDWAVMVKDLNMVEWMGGNCFRTSHYPYSEERLYEADRRGIAVFAETPAVGVRIFDKANELLHQQMLRELIERDRNHPSVIVWSVSNEPQTYDKKARPYFQSLVNLAHLLDTTRPVTIVYGPSQYHNDQTADFVDILCINRYFGWYIDMGHLETIRGSLNYDLTQWHSKFKKPIIVTEYGADSAPGMNEDPPRDFSESYQVELMRETHLAFDDLRAKGIVVGEMVWNFADFMTAQNVKRAVGNRKGMLTRNRQPKMAAYLLKQRYEMLNVNKTRTSYCSDGEPERVEDVSEIDDYDIL